MFTFIFGALTMMFVMIVIGSGRRRNEPERIYIPLESRHYEYERNHGWGWLGALPFIVILFILYQALAGA